ncbi:TetR family transcriptional regulator [Streptomyces zhihengii]|uniref:TetR family transcriptional regulator n=1 Tax=Streptomyces zhihengii TaxID=1818004 RepID=UPI0033B0461C
MLTRSALLDAAAREVDAHGYGSVAMRHVARAADVTTGALTFHFPTKSDLFAEVAELGLTRMRERADEVARLPVAPLRRISLLVLALLELLHDDVVARAAVRLSRELPGTGDWSDSWLPAGREMLRRADEAGQLREGVTPDAVAEMTLHLVAGTEMCAHGGAPASDGGDGDGGPGGGAAEPGGGAGGARFAALCDLLLYGASALRPPDPAPDPPRTASPRTASGENT